jgi:hypothetical protein
MPARQFRTLEMSQCAMGAKDIRRKPGDCAAVCPENAPSWRTRAPVRGARALSRGVVTKIGRGRLKRLRDTPGFRPPQIASAECSRWIDSAQRV